MSPTSSPTVSDFSNINDHMFQIKSLAGNSLPSKFAFYFMSSLLAIIGLNFIGAGFSSENSHDTWKPDNYLSLNKHKWPQLSL